MRRFCLARAFAVVVFSTLTSWSLAGIVDHWQVDTGNWSEDANWRFGEPTLGYSASIANGGTARITEPDEICDSLHLGYGSGTSGTVEMSSGSLSTPVELIGDWYGTGTFNHTGGANTTTIPYIGFWPGTTGTYNLNGTGQLSAEWENVGGSGTGSFTQSGGTNLISDKLLLGDGMGGNGTYILSGTGELSAAIEEFGRLGTATFTQTGGTNVTSYFTLGGQETGYAVYNLTAGTLTVSNDGDYASFIGYGFGGTGIFNLGDATGTGIINETGPGEGANLHVRHSNAPSGVTSGTLRGWGVVDLKGRVENDGRVIADGYGTDRTLDLSRFSRVTTQTGLGHLQGDGTSPGWYTQNHGRLLLPPITVATGTHGYKWGFDNWGNLAPVNIMWFNLSEVRSGGDMLVSLLAPDRADVPDASPLSLIGVWQVDPPAGFDFASAELGFVYDRVLANLLALEEDELRVYRLASGRWLDVTDDLDIANQRITTRWISELGPGSLFAVGAVPVPEPSTLIYLSSLAAAGLLAYAWRRGGRRVHR